MAWFAILPLSAKISLVAGAAGVGLQAVSAQQQAKAENRAAEYNAKIQERNSEIADMQAVSAEQRGEVAEKQHRLRIGRLKGSQRAAASGSGVVVDEGSPLDILQDTAIFGELDALTIRQNAAQEAWGYRTQAGDFTAKARLSRLGKRSPGVALTTTLLSGVGNLGDRYIRYKRVGVI